MAKEQPPTSLPKPKGWPDALSALRWLAKKMGAESAKLWPYPDAEGTEIAAVGRFNFATGHPDYPKSCRPFYRAGDGRWRIGDPPDGWPLFNLPAVIAAETVWLVEGEKCADIFNKCLGLPATTTAHGSASPHLTDRSPLAGKQVVICPDFGPAGEGYVTNVVRLLTQLDPQPCVKVLRLPGLVNDGDDIEQFGESRPGTTPEEDRAEIERLADALPWERPADLIGETDAADALDGPDDEDLAAKVRSVVQSDGVPGLLRNAELMGQLAKLTPAQLAPITADLRSVRGFSSRDFGHVLKANASKAKTNPGVAPGTREDIPIAQPLYILVNEGIAVFEPGASVSEPLPLVMNFDARIIEEEIRDDGREETRRYRVAAARADRRKSFADVEAKDFDGMTWVARQLGSDFVITAGRGVKDHARAAIQILSGEIPKKRVYTHTGWRRVGETYYYFSASGAIGPEGLEPSASVDLSTYGLSGFYLPDPPSGDELKAAVRASLGILRLAQPDRPRSFAAAALAVSCVYRAALRETRFTIQANGPTGSHKSCWAALAQQHYGSGLDYNHLPMSWSSTPNALQAMRHALKDALGVIDDYVPGGSRQERDKADKLAEDVYRSQGNGQGRQRMNPDGTLQAPMDPRGSLVTTGEDRPSRPSANLRTLGVWFEKDDNSRGVKGTIDKAVLTECQRDADAGLYAASLAAFLRWVAADYERVQDDLTSKAEAHRALATMPGDHGRTPYIVAELMAGAELFLQFALESKALTSVEADEYSRIIWEGLMEAASSIREEYQSGTDQATLFLNLVGSALSSCIAYLEGTEGPDVPEHLRLHCGWRKDLKYQGKDVGQIPFWVYVRRTRRESAGPMANSPTSIQTAPIPSRSGC